MPSLPQNKTWSQVSDRDNFDPNKYGSLIATTGIDLSENHGRLRLGKRMLLNTYTGDTPDLTAVPIGFWQCGTGIYTACGVANVGKALTNSAILLSTAFTASTGGTPPSKIDSTLSDGIFANNKLYMSELDAGTVYLCNKVGNNNWGSRISMQTDSVGYPHMLFFHISRIFMTNNQSCIISMNVSETVVTSGANTIVLNGISADFTNVITRPFVSGDMVFIPCVNTLGGQGFVYKWDGSQTTYNYKYALNSAGALSGCDYYGTPYIMDVLGNLCAFNGGVFKPVASLFRKNNKHLYNPLSLVNDRWLHPNGMKVVNDKIRVSIDNRNYDSTSSIEETISAGIYEFDPKHPEKGFINVGVFGLAKSVDTIIDYGALRIAGAGGIAEINLPSNSASRNGSFMAGAKYYTDATTTTLGIYYDDLNDTFQKAGSFVTLKFDADGIHDVIDFLRLVYSNFKTSTDKIVVKYRTVEIDPIEATITWTSGTTFTVLNSAIDLTTYYTSGDSHGSEVEIIHGIGANKCSHIASAVLAAGTWTVTVDQTYIGASGTAKARFQKWKWLGEANYAQGIDFLNTKPEDKASWFQFKVWMLWTGKVEIEGLLTNSEVILSKDLIT